MLIALMGGDIRVHSRPGQGTSFQVRLFLSEVRVPQAVVHVEHDIIGYQGARRRVLLVDDHIEHRRVLAGMLEPLGFEIVQAADGQEAVRQVALLHPDLILMDLSMPHMDGWETSRLIRRNVQSRAPIIVISANAFADDRERSVAADCNDYLAKPVHTPALLEDQGAPGPGMAQASARGHPRRTGRRAALAHRPGGAARAERTGPREGHPRTPGRHRARGAPLRRLPRRLAPARAALPAQRVQCAAESGRQPTPASTWRANRQEETMHSPSRDSAVVLIVDDTPDNLALLSDALDAAGYRVLVALDGASALERAQRSQPDVILLDAMMPGMDGFETCRRLKASGETADIPVLFMTALTESEHVVEGFAAGGIDYVTKPIKPDEVLARVAAHLRTARALQAVRSAPAPRPALDDEQTQEALASRFQLTGREMEVLHWVACGKTNRDIGDILGLSPRTVNKHLEHVYVKLGVETRTAAAAVAMSADVDAPFEARRCKGG